GGANTKSRLVTLHVVLSLSGSCANWRHEDMGLCRKTSSEIYTQEAAGGWAATCVDIDSARRIRSVYGCRSTRAEHAWVDRSTRGGASEAEVVWYFDDTIATHDKARDCQ